MSRILLVFRDPGLKNELSKRLDSESRDITIYPAATANEARTYLADQDFDLVVADLHVPSDVNTPVDTDTTPGLVLARWMRDSNIETPCILVRPKRQHPTPELDAKIGVLSQCTAVRQGTDMFPDLVKIAEILLSGEQPEKCEHVEIELQLSGSHSGSGENRFSVYVPSTGSKEIGALAVDNVPFPLLARLSAAVGKLSDRQDLEWKRSFREVGATLKDTLKMNANFYAAVRTALKEIGHPDDYSHAHLRFVVPRELHTVALEAVVDPAKGADDEMDTDLWMLEAPVYRVLSGEGIEGIKVGPLFTKKSTRPMRFLVIDANIDGDESIETDEVNPRDPESHLYLEHLPLVSEECDALVDRLKEEMENLNIAEPVLLRRNPGEQGFWERVQEQLKHDWDLVHYAGHSYYHEQGKRACVFFHADDHHVKPIGIEVIANQLRSASLVFLSSCQSFSEGFVFKLAESGVPGIIGFRWPIEDELAVEFAECFYEKLFERKAVDKAFFLARRQMHDKKNYGERKVWASPVLVEQKI